MAYKISYNKTFLDDSLRTAYWLEKEWSKKAADKFAGILYAKIQRIAENPFIGSRANKGRGVRKMTITEFNRVYYRVKGQTIIFLALFETRQNPRKNRYE